MNKIQNDIKYSNFQKVLRMGKLVFTLQDLALLWNYQSNNKASDLARYYCNKKFLFRIKNGLYTTTELYDPFLLANKLVPASYISLFTALKKHGVIFQWYADIYCVGNISKKFNLNSQTFIYSKFKQDLCFNPLGIIEENGVRLASLERSICDTLYLYPETTFDNLRNVDFTKLLEIAQIYNNQQLLKTVYKLQKTYAIS